MKLPKIEDVTFRVECEEEHAPVRGNAQASGDDAQDREAEDAIIRDLNNGNSWAWCCVHVVAEWRGFKGHDYLGACSYESEASFREPGGYFEQMREEAFADLLGVLRDTAKRLGCDETVPA